MALNAAAHAPAADFAISPPDDFYYASLYLAPAARAAARALEAARRAILAVPREVGDRGVAHLKLAWWEQELARLTAGEPRHPLTLALRPLLARWPDLPALLERTVHYAVASLAEPRHATRAALVAALRAAQDDVTTRYLELGTRPADAHRDTLLDVAVRVELAHALRGLRQHRRGGGLYLADESLTAAGLSVAGVRDARRSAELGTLVTNEMTWLREELRNDLAALPRATRRGQALVTTLAYCALDALALTLADDCRVLEQRVELLPLRKLWLAWRTRYLG